MTLLTEIEQAFAHRQKPSKLIEMRGPITPEQRDALWFGARDWREIGWADWDRHPDAFYAFVPEAFIYYLPSILVNTTKTPESWLQPADALLGILNRSPEVYHWDTFITTRLLGLEAKEYEVIKVWLLSLSSRADLIDEDGLVRAYETVDLLQRETARLRGLLTR